MFFDKIQSFLPSVCFFLCFVFWNPVEASKNKTTSVQRFAQKIHKKGGYPSHLPDGNVEKTKDSSNQWIDNFLKKLFGKRLEKAVGWSFERMSPFATFLFYLLVGLSIVAFLYLFLWWTPRWKSQASVESFATDPTEWMGFHFSEDSSLDDLTSQGELGAAICFLFWKSLRRSGWSADGKGKSQTGREIVGRFSRDSSCFEPAFRLLELAEKVRFAKIPATQEMLQQAIKWSLLFEKTWEEKVRIDGK